MDKHRPIDAQFAGDNRAIDEQFARDNQRIDAVHTRDKRAFAKLRCCEERQIKVFDTTLRDGQQCPGAGMSFAENIEYARLACLLKVDVLEAGFPSASATDFNIVNRIAEEVLSMNHVPVVAALCQLREEQVIKTIQSLAPLIPHKKARLHTYVPVDPELMPASLGKSADDKKGIVEDVYRLVKMAVDAGLEVQFSPEGYSRMREHFDFTTELIRAAIAAGAGVINCPDTIGGASSLEGSEYFVEKMKAHAQIMEAEFPERSITWSVHCHNDFGLAVQNTINAVFDGPARQIEGCINGIGERAGNASLEQCIMIIKHFGDRARSANPFFTGVATERIQAISDFVSKHMLPRQPHWPVSGDNAAKHSSGGHTNAILKNPLAYQPFDPKEVGKRITMLFGPLSGGNHAKSIIESYGYVCADEEKAAIAQFIKDQFSDRRKGITDEELMDAYHNYRRPISIERFDYGKRGNRATVIMHGRFFDYEGKIEEEYVGKESSLAAVKKAIEKKFSPIQILSHRSWSESAGFDANSVSRVVVANANGELFEGKGIDRDIEISAIKALIDAANKAYIDQYFSCSSTEEDGHAVRKPQQMALSVAS
ncbi:MAG TPA: alpha-isopropylmalate synthase regulatory domain-containing protein [Candidatus Obscuribacterales bacterium]